MKREILGVLLDSLLAAVVAAEPQAALAQDARQAPKSENADGAKAARPLTAQQLKLKECGAKWQEEKKAKGVKGREAWNAFRTECLKG